VLFLSKCFLSLQQQINHLITFKIFVMKKSTYVLAFIIVIVFFGLLTLAAFALNNGNAGLHFN